MPANRQIRGAYTALVTPFCTDRRDRQAGIRSAGPPPARRLHRRAGPGRQHRREPHSQPRGTRVADPRGRGDRLGAPVAPPRQDRRQHRQQRHRGHDPRHSPRGGVRRRPGDVRGPLLQQARPADDRGSLPGHCRRRRACQSSSTTCRVGPESTSQRPRCCAWPSTLVSWPSRKPRRTWTRSPRSCANGRPASPSWPATTSGRCRCSRWRRRGDLHLRQRDPRRDGGDVRGRSAGDWDTARRIHERWLPLMKANFVAGRTRSGQDRPRADGPDHGGGATAAPCHSKSPIALDCAWSSRQPAHWSSARGPPPNPTALPAATVRR